MDRALYDFAEAAMGQNAQMSWSLSEAVLRRQVAPIFKRCARGDLSAEQALDVALDFVTARVTNTLEVFNSLFQVLEAKIDIQMHGSQFPALAELNEFFWGLNSEAQWATDESISRREFHHLFSKVADNTVSIVDGIVIFCDAIIAKKEFYLDLIHGMCLRLTQQILHAQRAREAAASDEGNGDQEKIGNGDE